MRTQMQNSWLLALGFSLYETVLMWFFGLPEFVGPLVPSWQLLIGLLFALIIVFQLTALIVRKYMHSGSMTTVIILLTSVVLTSVAGWLALRIDSAYTLSYFSGFLLSAVVFTVFYYLLLLLRDMPAGLTINTNQDGEITGARAVLAIDHKGRGRQELPLDSIICFEANDNYVTIHYLSADEKPTRRLERLSMRKVEELLQESEELFLRVHKSYLINKKYVEEITGKSQAYRIRLKHLEEPVPVSRTVKIREMLPNH